MIAPDQPAIFGSSIQASASRPLVGRHEGWTLLWLGLALVVAALLLVGLGEGGVRAAGPPPVTVGTAAYQGDAA